MPVLVHSIATVATAGSIGYVTVPVERVEPIVVNEPITVQVRRCQSIPVYMDPPRHVLSHTNSNVLGGIVGAVIGGKLTKGEARPYGAVIGAIIGMQINQQPSVVYVDGVYSNEPAYFRQHCGLSVENQLREMVRGYRASYRLNGVEHWVALDHHPGTYITVNAN
jgi:uncharacterized protein YcfJ